LQEHLAAAAILAAGHFSFSYRTAIAALTSSPTGAGTLAHLVRFAILPLATLLVAGAPASRLPGERLVLRMDRVPAASFEPDEALGAAIDGTERGGVERILTPHNVATMRGAGLRSLTYRLKTELGIEVWHWNPAGRWSDPVHRQGYWTSSDALGPPIRLSWGYRLPRRGDTNDQANNQGYSRLTDGDRATFWKSNPYLDPAFLRDGLPHPQWLVLRFDRKRPVDAAVIDWGTPWAVRYEVQYWTGANEDDGDGRWVTFPGGRVANGRGGRTELRLATRPIATTHVRVLLEQGSGTAPAGSTDWRDRAGYAVREVAFGLRRKGGAFEDAVVHAPANKTQTFAHVSSTDPWHRASDRDPDLEQTGIDRFFASKLTFGKPPMIATGLLYDTPDNVRNELTYIARGHYKVSRIELGEEPDGQYASAADYGALYLATFDRVKGILPGVRIGGPSLQSAFTDTWMQPDAPPSWDGWLARYLKQRGRLGAMQFVSFEFYPFDDICGDISRKLIGETVLLGQAWSRLTNDGWPRRVPRIISEYGFSAFSGRVESEMPSALLTADIAGQWLTLGGKAAYLFGYPPNWPATHDRKCGGYGNMMLFMADQNGQAGQPMPNYYAARLLTQAWTEPGVGPYRVVPSALEGAKDNDVATFALRRPDGRISLLLVNRSATRPHVVVVDARRRGGREVRVRGPAAIFSYGPRQYSWIDAGQQSHPGRDRPPVRRHLGAEPLNLELRPLTMTVIVLDNGKM
jgi:hypothetical protein